MIYRFQRLILQPCIETMALIRELEDYNVKNRHRLLYISIGWEQAVGETISIMEVDGEDSSSGTCAAGLEF